MSSAARRAAVFSDALHGMYRMYEPDIILIACNTLSAVYPQTGFARDPPVPVVGIVDLGVRLLHEKLVAQPDAAAVLFGTETTINSGAHRDGLMSLGIPARRITPQACPGLAGAIETDATGRRVATSIDRFACDAARAASPDVRSLIAGICCTHYAYCTSQFVVALQRHSGKPVEIVDPTRHMSLLVVPEGSPPVFPGPQITVAAVSRAVITAEEIVSIGGLLEPVSPATAEALRSYTVRRDLFPYDPE
jgi:glutamate racemase